MASAPAKPWELPTEEPDDPEANEKVAKETDALLGKKKSTDDDSYDYTFGAKDFLEDLNDEFGHKLLWMLVAAQFLVKGFTRDFTARAEPYLYKEYHVPASQMQIYQGVTQLPWAMKPIIGMVSDMFPVMGYNKAPYMWLTSLAGVASYALVGLSSPATIGIGVVVICFVLMQAQGSAADLLSEAKYSEKIRDSPKNGPALLSFVWTGINVGTLVAVMIAGVALDAVGPQHVYLMATIPAASIIIPLCLNYMEEREKSSEEISESRSHFMQQQELVWLSLLMLGGSLTLLIVGLHSQGPATNAAVGVFVAMIELVGFSVLLSPIIAKFNAFSLIQTSMSLVISGASFYFYTDTKEQYPEGPHFSPFFFNSVVGVVNALMSLLGIYFYQRYMKTWNYQTIMITTNLAYGIMCLPDVLLFTRYNLNLGIPDHFFMLGSTVAQNLIFQWQWMPQVVILASLCPKGKEATMYALLAGCHNLGNTIASNCGALLLEWLECAPRGAVHESDQFTNLWKASLIASCMPLVTIVMIPYLVPNARQVDAILDENDDSATKGSLLRRWTGRE
jgi:folate/biopterin transporter